MTSYEYLTRYCEEVSAWDFYRDIFPSGELEEKGVYEEGKYTGIAVSVNDIEHTVKRYTLTDDLGIIDLLCASNDFCLMSPISYAGKSRKSINARYLFAMAIDLDGLKEQDCAGVPLGISTLFYQFDGNGPSNYLPKPTYIVASGSGLHLYYVFDEPVPLYRNFVEELERLKRRLTWQLWTQGVSKLHDSVQYESLFQGFRVVGTVTKDGGRARAFMVDSGKKVSVEYLNQFVPPEHRASLTSYQSKLSLAESKERYPEWYDRRIVNGEAVGRWVCKRDLYEWWKRQIVAGAEDGHRYWCIQTLAAYAIKSAIPYDELARDALSFVDLLNERSTRPDNPFTIEDAMKAIESYNITYATYPIHTIVDRTGIFIAKNKRNGLKQKQHLYLARRRKEDMKAIELPMKAPEGRPDKAEIVLEWQRSHPNGKKAECIRATGLSKPTVYRWWSN